MVEDTQSKQTNFQAKLAHLEAKQEPKDSNLLIDDLMDDSNENLIEDSPLLLLQTERQDSMPLLMQEDQMMAMSPVKDESPLMPAARTYRTENRNLEPYKVLHTEGSAWAPPEHIPTLEEDLCEEEEKKGAAEYIETSEI